MAHKLAEYAGRLSTGPHYNYGNIPILDFPTPNSDCTDAESSIFYENLRKNATLKFAQKHLFNTTSDTDHFRGEIARVLNAAMVEGQGDIKFEGITNSEFIKYFGRHIYAVPEEGECFIFLSRKGLSQI